MNTDRDKLKRRLCEGYTRQASRYQRALQILKDAGDDWDAVAAELSRLFAEIAADETFLAEQRERWRKAGYESDDDLRSVLDEVARLISALLDQIQAAEKTLRLKCEQLMPEIDVGDSRQENATGLFWCFEILRTRCCLSWSAIAARKRCPCRRTCQPPSPWKDGAWFGRRSACGS
ncbi:MAG: hypothetical protein KatS3mg105_0761 [Gemmatales bacterium]|nr:MAG: hypothetical protein KatS3mg105_0761 [Gemmatales bacterium]